MMETTPGSLLHQKTLCVITGASRGIGKEIAIRLSANVAPHSKFLLLARNEKDLLETAREIQKNLSVTADIFVCDLSETSHGDTLVSYEKKLKSVLADGAPFEVAMIIHNAATVGDISKPASKFDNAQIIHDYLDLNVTSFILLNNSFLRILGTNAKQCVVVNITSLLAIKSVPGLGLYAIGKAAREAFMRSLAAEEPGIRVINYSPGPVKTDMAIYVKDTIWHEETQEWYKQAFESGTILTVDQTTTKFLRFLDENTFENGSHVDYHDLA